MRGCVEAIEREISSASEKFMVKTIFLLILKIKFNKKEKQNAQGKMIRAAEPRKAVAERRPDSLCLCGLKTIRRKVCAWRLLGVWTD